MHFGAAVYYDRDFRQSPETAVAVVELLSKLGSGTISVRGMLSDSDKWVRATSLSEKSKRTLIAEIRDGMFSDLVAEGRSANSTTASISIQLFDGNPHQEGRLTYSNQSQSDYRLVEEVSVALWKALEARYGFSIFGRSEKAVLQELSATPIVHWQERVPADTEQRLLRIQRHKRSFGTDARGAAWGTFLGPELVERLGGEECVKQEAPVQLVEKVADGLYLRLLDHPLLIESPEYEGPAARLERYLSAVMPHDLVKR
jgi:hypothetical protein